MLTFREDINNTSTLFDYLHADRQTHPKATEAMDLFIVGIDPVNTLAITLVCSFFEKLGELLDLTLLDTLAFIDHVNSEQLLLEIKSCLDLDNFSLGKL